MNYRSRSLLILSVGFALCANSPLAFATNQVVTDPGDTGGVNQLRAKLAAAQSTGGGTITFNVGAATINLVSMLPHITSTVTIDGGGMINLNGNGGTAFFFVDPSGVLTLKNILLENGYGGSSDGGAIYNDGQLTLENMTIQHSVSPFHGGAIYNLAPLHIMNCTLADNIAGSGGAIYSLNTDVTITDSIFSGNTADTDDFGGALYTLGPLTITNCEFAGNKAGSGGGIYAGSLVGTTSATITESYFHDNETTGSFPNANGAALLIDNLPVTINTTVMQHNLGQSGGAIYVLADGHLTMTQATLADNSSTNGGGIYNKGVITLTNVTIYQNTASHGGGIDNFATATITNSTFARNEATYGDSIKNETATGVVTLASNIFRNIAPADLNLFNEGGIIISHGYNLSNDAAGGDATTGPGGFLNGTGDIRNTDPMLDPAGLRNNGGLTPTIGLAVGSPAIDKGKSNSLTTDQRGTGFPRTFDDPAISNAAGGDGTDIGAFERNPAIAAPALPVITVSVSATEVNEGGSISFTFSASAANPFPLITIFYSVSGKALNGVDYLLSGTPGQVTILAGNSSATVTLQALMDEVSEKKEKVTLKLNTATGYKLGKAKKASTTIINQR